MEKKPLISVVVPVYNVEGYLSATVDSLLAQSYENIEILLVDDGSTDNSPAVCDEYASRDSRVRVIHKQNGGVSSARNAALDIARGEYIAFCDSDDTVEPDIYERLYKSLVENEADISVCGFSFIYPDKKISSDRGNIINLDCEQALSGMLIGRHFEGHLWNKLFLRSLIGDIRMDTDIHVYEDLLFVFSVMMRAGRVCYDSTPCYNYYMRESSVCHTPLTEKQISAHCACEKIRALVENEGLSTLTPYVDAATVICNMRYVSRLSYNRQGRREFAKFAKRNIRRSLNRRSLSHLGGMMKIRALIAAVSLHIYYPIQRVLKKNYM